MSRRLIPAVREGFLQSILQSLWQSELHSFSSCIHVFIRDWIFTLVLLKRMFTFCQGIDPLGIMIMQYSVKVSRKFLINMKILQYSILFWHVPFLLIGPSIVDFHQYLQKKIQRSFATTLRLLCRFSILSLVLMKTSTFEYCFTISIFPLLALNSQLIQRDFRKSGGVPNSIFKMICPETVHKCDETPPTRY